MKKILLILVLISIIFISGCIQTDVYKDRQQMIEKISDLQYCEEDSNCILGSYVCGSFALNKKYEELWNNTQDPIEELETECAFDPRVYDAICEQNACTKIIIQDLNK